MNQKAAELNMEKTKYCNSHGLSNPENRSCAFDLAIISEYAMNNSDFRRIVSCKTYEA
jgi:D-alanyl-D-alanine carboxypeptidase (penicillin-binding protein 5/6)